MLFCIIVLRHDPEHEEKVQEVNVIHNKTKCDITIIKFQGIVLHLCEFHFMLIKKWPVSIVSLHFLLLFMP